MADIPSPGKTFTVLEWLVIVVGGGLIVYGLWKGVDALGNFLGSAFQTIKDKVSLVTVNAPWAGNGQPLTDAQAQTIAKGLGIASDYQLSPDKFQIWFFNGSYYDNHTGEVFDVNGNSAGLLLQNDGTFNPNAAAVAVGGPIAPGADTFPMVSA